MKRLFSPLAFAFFFSFPFLCSSPAAATDAIRIIVPFAEGDASDVIARILAGPLGTAMGRPVSVLNHYGAGGIIGTQEVVRARTDGLTIVLGSVSNMSMNAVCRGERLGYTPSSAFRPVVTVARAPVVLAAGPQLPASSLAEVLDTFRAQPGIHMYASSGLCGYTDFMGRYLAARAGVDVVPMPYRGGRHAVEAAIAGDADVVLTELPNAASDLAAGRIRPLAATSGHHLGQIPSFKDLGYPALDAGVWYGLFVPAETPSREAGFIQNAIRDIMADPAIQQQLAAVGAEPYTLSRAEIFREIVNGTRALQTAVEEARLTLE